MKPHKMDVTQGFTSNCFLHAPDILFELLSLVFKDWLIHGTVTKSILSCAFIPLLKSSLKDPAKTDSYRAIAGSSLLLKLFEQCVLLVWGTSCTVTHYSLDSSEVAVLAQLLGWSRKSFSSTCEPDQSQLQSSSTVVKHLTLQNSIFCLKSF